MFATTKEGLIRGAATLGTLFVEDALPISDLARQISLVCDIPKSEAKGQVGVSIFVMFYFSYEGENIQFKLSQVFETLKSHGRYVLDNPPDPRAVELFKTDAWSPWSVTTNLARRPA